MMRSSPASPINTFVVRLWRERSATEAHWRGTVEHMQSGQRGAFLDLAGLVGFLQRLGVTIPADSGGSPGAGPKRFGAAADANENERGGDDQPTK